MSPEEFIAHLETLVGAPGGVKKLREMILALAIQGKLVPQEPGDESAPSLLERIETLKKQPQRKGSLPQKSRLPEVTPAERPHALPPQWCWVRLGHIGTIVGGATPSTSQPEYWSDEKNGIPWLTPADLYGLKARFIGSGRRYLSKLGLENSSSQLLPAGSVLFSSRAPIGYVAIAERALATNQGFKSCVPVLMEMNLYLHLFLKAMGPTIDANASGTTFKEVSGKDMSMIVMPLPPLAEQQRITAKVDQLMLLCDALEARLTRKDEAGERLTQSALEALTSAEDPEEFAKAWKRVADHFDILFRTPESVEQLRQTILDLALGGRFSPRDEALAWPEKPLGELAQLITKGTTPTSLGHAFTASGVRFIKVENVKHGVILRDSIRDFISEETHEALRRSQLQAGDVLFSIAGTIGETCVVTKKDLPANTNQALAIIRVPPEVLDQPFLRIQLDSFVAHQIKQRARGGAMNNVSLADLRALTVRVPPLEEQKRLVARVERLMGLCDALESRLRETETRAQRLAGAMTAAMVA